MQQTCSMVWKNVSNAPWDLGWYVDMVHLLDRQLLDNLREQVLVGLNNLWESKQ